MLKRETLVTWTKSLVDFINGDVTGRALEKPLRGAAKNRTDRYYDNLRAEAEAEVRNAMRRKFAPRLGAYYLVTELSGRVTHDAKGRVELAHVQAGNIDALVSIVIAELQARNSPVEIRECAADACDTLFMRKRGRGSGNRGFPQKYCSDECEEDQRERNDKRIRRK